MALSAIGALASPASTAPGSDAAAVDECGSLGVMSYNASALPDSVDPANIRKCAGHPVGSASLALAKRDCHYGSTHGCSDGYCWKQCGAGGSGQWCWTAHDSGYGPWIACSSASQCTQDASCGIGDCDACGCSC